VTSERDNRFTIQPDDHHGIYTGLAKNGIQMLATQGIGANSIGEVLVIAFFHSNGEMTHFVENPPLYMNFVVTHNLSENDALYEKVLISALQQIGFETLQEIHVKKFFIPKHLFGVRQYPDSLQRFLEGGPEYTQKEIADLRLFETLFRKHHCLFFSEKNLSGYSEQEDADDRAWFEDWKARGDYVLWRQNDYWCDSKGHIHSS
jgi:hypothetical protein